ncbi:MAG: class I SAM-dependent methyltransferase [Deltaproteobacteria bacterium]|nr:class I SAM-dependent methyltransferase [Deltaproteobacteria bacterium]RLB38612.1 MAG: class I SAM-dependent methyltransferase [Deltaproteobacteria bacterium]
MLDGLPSRELLERTKGFLDEEEGAALYRLALRAAPLGPCLEIGSYCGKSALYLGEACRKTDNILFSIDHHRGSEEQQPGEEYFDPDLFDYERGCVDTFRFFRRTLARAGLEENVIPIVSASAAAARKWSTPLGLVFIDGGHSFEAAKTDFLSWEGHLVPEGYLLIHDIFKDPDEGGQAPYEVYKLALGTGRYRELPMVKTLGILRKRI